MNTKQTITIKPLPKTEIDVIKDEAYSRGRRGVWVFILGEALRQLGYKGIGGDEKSSQWALEREQAISTLREICGEFGDNDWDENLHLTDVIEKHLLNHLRGN